jgi:hypothetical protein
MQQHNINILFYSPTVKSTRYHKRTLSTKAGALQHVYLNTVPLYLNTYIKKSDPELYSMLNWKRIILTKMGQDELVTMIDELEINVLCFSSYSWNQYDITEVMTGIKAKVGRDILIIAGGPSVDVVRNDNYLLENPDVDFAVFTDGEKPFRDILANRFLDKPINVLSTKNAAWMKDGKLRKASYEFFVNMKDSPYLESAHLLKQMVEDPLNANATFELPYETSRGCPHGCTFCDWTSGLSHKAVKRKSNYELELELFGELGIRFLFFADANFGMWPVDVEIAKKMAELKPKYDFETYTPNMSKTKKDRVFEIMDIFFESGIVEIGKFSVQDIDATVLANIDRPDLPWEEHKVYIKEIMAKHPTKNFKIEMIKGLPGQTRATWVNMFAEAYSLKLKPEAFNWIVLPNSPAGYDKSYREKFKITTKHIETNLRQEQVVSTYSFSELDYAYFSVAEYLHRILAHLQVTVDELRVLLTDTSALWETSYLPKALENILHKGSLQFEIGNWIIHEIFDAHPLSAKYHESYQTYLADNLIIHDGYIRENLL